MYDFKEIWGFDPEEPSHVATLESLRDSLCFTETDEAYLPEADDDGDFYDKLYTCEVRHEQ
jgi:hypothetical protein